MNFNFPEPSEIIKYETLMTKSECGVRNTVWLDVLICGLVFLRIKSLIC